MANPWMKNFDEIISFIRNEVNSKKTDVCARKAIDLVDTGHPLDYERIDKDDVETIKENTKKKHLDYTSELIEKWLNEEIFENGKYDKMDREGVIALSKYIFSVGVKLR